jgi:PAS domain S-box-containing protein
MTTASQPPRAKSDVVSPGHVRTKIHPPHDGVEALRVSEERFRQLAMNAPAAIYIKDAEGRYTFANIAACEALGLPAGVAGQSDHDLLPAEIAEQLRQHDLEVISTGRSIEMVELLERDGTTREFLSVKFPLCGAGGETIGVCGVSTDITERRRAEAALRESEERFARFMQHLPGLAWIKDAEGRYVFANGAAVEAFQTTPDRLYGSFDTDLFPPEVAQAFIENDRAALASGNGVQTLESLRQSDGELHHSLVSKFPIPGTDGSPAWVGGMAIDVTARRQAEEALLASEQRFRALASHAPVGIFQTNELGETVFVNECWCAMTGLSQEQARGDGWIRAIHPNDRDRVVPNWIEAVEAGRPSEAEFRFLRPDGVVTWLQGNAVPIRNDAGALVGYMGTVVDVTARKEAEFALKEADRRKDEFLAVLAHELRNPLAPIRTGLELMRLAADDRALVEDIRSTMERQTQQMVRLIDDLLDVSRITRGTFELRTTRVELARIVESALETARPFIHECGHRYSVDVPAEAIVLEADPTRLAQVIANLLNNAAKYTPRGGQISLEVARDGDEVVVRVTDSGIGIPAEMLDRIFDMFTQVDRSLERSHGGLGIGLTLVRRLVEMHGGSVAVASAGEGRGSEFSIRLPVSPAAGEREMSGVDDVVGARGRRRVLVADDNEQAARVLGMLLTMMGNDVRIANDGLEAVELADKFRPDIAFLDIGMPKLNGYEAARRIRKQPWGNGVVLAALTGWGQEDDRRRTGDAGFDHHFVKPIEPAALQRLLAERTPDGN